MDAWGYNPLTTPNHLLDLLPWPFPIKKRDKFCSAWCFPMDLRTIGCRMFGGLSPTLGETAARLVDVMEALTGSLSDEKLENLVQSLYQDQMDD
jgi:hypothetical protein